MDNLHGRQLREQSGIDDRKPVVYDLREWHV
jgi:hypothetical protein